jgi:hypothetical protein
MGNREISIIIVVMFFMIIISIQYTLNKILLALKEIKTILLFKDKNRE